MQVIGEKPTIKLNKALMSNGKYHTYYDQNLQFASLSGFKQTSPRTREEFTSTSSPIINIFKNKYISQGSQSQMDKPDNLPKHIFALFDKINSCRLLAKKKRTQPHSSFFIKRT